MENLSIERKKFDKWLILLAVSLVFFFLNLSTFTSLGVVLYTMVSELHWSMAAAGFSFSLLGLACGLSSPLASLTIKWIGGRATLCVGAVLLIAGFALASLSHGILEFYAAMILVGSGYSLAGNIPGVYLIAGWFEQGAARIIGLYMMLGALGAAVGPPIVEAIVANGDGWRGHWRVMAIVAGVIGVLCFVLVRDRKVQNTSSATASAPTASGWQPRDAVFTSQFMLVAASMAATMFGVTTISSVAVPHLVKLGATPTAGAFALSVMAITATLVKGVAGRLCETIEPHVMLAVGLVLQAIGCVTLSFADTTILQYGSPLLFGVGWGLSFVAATVVLLNYFGPNTGSRILAIVWLLTTVAAAGPFAAGIIADHYGTFAPIFQLISGLMLLVALPIFVMREPTGVPDASPVVS